MTEEARGQCVRCGVETLIQLGDEFICEECFSIRGSCCPEFGSDDLTTENAPADETE